MVKIKRLFFVLLTFAFLSGLFVGCGGGPDEEQLKQLADLKAEVEKLQSDVSKLESEKTDLQKQIAKQDESIKNFQKLTDAVKNCK
jgi:septal ring factor EnvC (AmiA/AmiB activator)